MVKETFNCAQVGFLMSGGQIKDKVSILRGVYFNVQISYKVYLFSCKVSKHGYVDLSN